jgi:predicted enzyme related to lactoylglutathione lyase
MARVVHLEIPCGDLDRPERFSVNTIGVDDLSETERRVAAAGREPVRPRDDIPGVGSVASFEDTEGDIFGAIQPA